MRVAVCLVSLLALACGASAPRPEPLPSPAMIEVSSRGLRMGSPDDEVGRDPDEGPRSSLVLGAFRADIAPVTVADFEARIAEVRARVPGALILFEHDTPEGWVGRCNLGSTRRDHPVTCVPFEAARAYCLLRGADLPTEAEREAMARAATEFAYFWGDSYDASHTVGSVGCGARGCAGSTAPVVRSGPRCNALGLCDVAGNVWEWTLTSYQSRPGPYAVEVPAIDVLVEQPVIRGGSWLDEEPRRFRSAFRGLAYPDNGLTHIGFRCVVRM